MPAQLATIHLFSGARILGSILRSKGTHMPDVITPEKPQSLTSADGRRNLVPRQRSPVRGRKACARSSAEMDEKGVFDTSLIEQFFQLGPDGHRDPGAVWRRRRQRSLKPFSPSRSSRASTPRAGVIVDVQNTLVNNAILRWGNEEQKKRYLPRMASEWVRRLCAERGRIRLGRLRSCHRARN